MTSLSVNLPWQSFVAPRLPELRAGLARDLPGFEVRFETSETELTVVLEAEGGAAAVFMVAEYVAPMWPALLGDYGVALAVVLGGARWVSAPASMVALARGERGRTAWLADVEFVPAE